MPTIESVLQRHTDGLMALPGVVGVYQGLTEDGRACIRVIVVQLTPELERSIPKSLDGYPVEIEAGGPIRPLDGK
jgi:hypothetical protein